MRAVPAPTSEALYINNCSVPAARSFVFFILCHCSQSPPPLPKRSASITTLARCSQFCVSHSLSLQPVAASTSEALCISNCSVPAARSFVFFILCHCSQRPQFLPKYFASFLPYKKDHPEGWSFLSIFNGDESASFSADDAGAHGQSPRAHAAWYSPSVPECGPSSRAGIHS